MSNIYPSQARTYHAEVLPGEPYQAPHGQPPAPSGGGNRLLWFVLGCGGMLLMMCCGGMGALGFGAYRIVSVEKPGIDAELTAYFNDLKSKDLDAACTHFSNTVLRRQTKEQVMAALNTPIWQSFDGFESYQTAGIQVFWGRPVAPGEPAATTASVNGTIRFKDGRTGTFTATMEKQGEQWRIFGINANAPQPAGPPATK